MEPPPPYAAPSDSPFASSSPSDSPLLRLPIHLLLQILSHASLPTLAFDVKPVCRSLRLVACAITRSTPSLQEKWLTRIRANQRNASTGVFNSRIGAANNGGYEQRSQAVEASKLSGRTREEEVYDIWIASQARYERDRSASYLLLDGGEEFDDGDEWTRSFERDLFGFLQPRARCEDLVIERGKRDRWIEDAGTDPDRSTNVEERERRNPNGLKVQEKDVKVELKLKSARLLLPVLGSASKPVWKPVVEVNRLPDGSLEEVAYHLSSEFRKVNWRRVVDSRNGVISYVF